MNQVEPVLCHAPETLRLVRLARSIDEALRRTPQEAKERLIAELGEWIEHGLTFARDDARL